MSDRRSFALVGLAVFLVAVAMRTIPLYWSYLPFNLDGFQFAAPARYALQHGHLPSFASYFQPDKYSFSVLLTIVSQLTGVSPLRIAQPLIAVIGAVPCLVAVSLVRRIGTQRGWHVSQARLAAAVAGLVLAVEGIYLGRSAAVTSEGAGIVFVALLAVVFYRALRTGRSSWMLLSFVFVFLLPLTHVLATIEGALVVTALLALSMRRFQTRALRFGVLLVAVFWVYLGGYYSILEMGEMGRVTSAPGLFVAWLLVLVMLSVWVPTASPRLQRGLPFGLLFVGCTIFAANFFVPVFPGTAATPSLVLLLTAPVTVIGIFASWGTPFITNLDTDGEVVVALLFGPLVLIGFALTGGLTFEYQGIVVRGQIFVHLAAVVLAALAAVSLGYRSVSGIRFSGNFQSVLVPLLVLSAIVSTPLAFLGLHATPAQPLTTPDEFEATTFATTHASERWISDGHISRLASYYYPTRTNVTYRPVYQWLYGNERPPQCLTLSQESWTTTGAQLFPAAPAQIDNERYNGWIASHHVIYTTGGADPIVISRPEAPVSGLCQE
ncbi:sodium/phosphate symporter [Haladaptatus sp. DFWS20]|uniref:sodium/phosphate symporter n=1 Tax=Haladaptatus sp. DFWS20 TaxID=3403467 RepID=UPI003EB895CA